MRKVVIIFFLLMSCNNRPTPKKDILTDTNSTGISVQDSIKLANKQYEDLLSFSERILHDIKQSRSIHLINYISDDGLRLSPYGHIDIKKDVMLSRVEFQEFFDSDQKHKIKFGYYDGSGEPINMTLREYFKEFVYDVDFENMGTVSVNSCKGQGNSKNNISEIYKGFDFVEYYYAGSGGMDSMDWKALRLVYKKEDNIYRLIGIVHDQWTI